MKAPFRTTLLAGLGIVAIGLLAANAQQVPGAGSTINAVFNMVYDASTMKPTYTSTARVTVASAATDVCALAGSATKMVKVRKIALSTVASTAIAEPVAFIKRSTAPTGAGVQPSVIPLDSNNVLTNTTNVATAIVEVWTANPTVGTAVGALGDPTLLWTGAATAQPYTEFDFGSLSSPIVLRGVAESIAVNLNGLTYTAGNLGCTFVWTEE